MSADNLPPNEWLKYYDNPGKRISLERITSAGLIHCEFLQTILKTEADQVIEIGIGTGALGYCLSEIARERGHKLKIVEIDLHQEFLHGAQNFYGKQSYLSSCVGDTFNLPFFDKNSSISQTTIFHQGLMEHFDDKSATEMVREQLRVAKTVIASVPSDKYCFQDGLRGDERLLSLNQWRDVLGKNFSVFGYYYGKFPGEKYQICLTINAK